MVSTPIDERTLLDDDTCWQAMEQRDARYDGLFVCAVRSTGIYCRPSCPARKPHRHNVTFMADCDAAERAGYRACKRCRPGEIPQERAVIQDVVRYIEANPDADLTLAALGAQAGYSPTHLQRLFKRIVGISPRQYAEAVRVNQLKAGLKDGVSVTEASYGAGFGSMSRLYAGDAAPLGMSPSTYRQGGKGARIGYTIVESPLGRLLVAATGRGLTAVSLGDDDERLEAYLFDEYPAAEIERDDERLAEAVGAVLACIRGEEPNLDLPIDVQATAFQWRVWNALRAIPVGETRSYSQIANVLGKPRAARAVARACATNRVAILIPCHRVVRESGELGGYRWGIERKRRLLSTEHEASARREPVSTP